MTTVADDYIFHQVMTPHDAECIVSEAKIRKSYSGIPYVNLRMYLVSGPYKGRTVFYSYFPHIVEARIAQEALGLPTTTSKVPEAEGMKFNCRVCVRKLDDREYNFIKLKDRID